MGQAATTLRCGVVGGGPGRAPVPALGDVFSDCAATSGRRPRLALAAEAGGGYGLTPSAEERLAGVAAAVGELAQVDLDGLSDQGLEGLLAGLRTPIGQLAALRSRVTALSQSRRLAAAPKAPTGGVIREHQDRLADLQNRSAADTKRDVEAGRAARDNPATGRAFDAGQLSAEHARMIGRILAELPADRREPVETELLTLATTMDPVAFGRAARRIQAREIPASLARDERRQHGHRRFRAADTADGGFVFSGLLFGAAAETARVALDAFRRPDTPDEHRHPEQRSADAFEQLCTAALRSGQAPTDHGIRPHVLIVFDAEEYDRALAGGIGHATLARSGQPATTGELGHLLADAEMTRIVLDAAGTPIEVSTTSRHVPIGLWKALIVRDGGCTWPGCNAPASWCDVAHGHTPYAADGRLSPSNAALLCRRHHRRFDNGNYTIHIHGRSVTYQRHDPTDQPQPEPSPEPEPEPGSELERDPPGAPGTDLTPGPAAPPSGTSPPSSAGPDPLDPTHPPNVPDPPS